MLNKPANTRMTLTSMPVLTARRIVSGMNVPRSPSPPLNSAREKDSREGAPGDREGMSVTVTGAR